VRDVISFEVPTFTDDVETPRRRRRCTKCGEVFDPPPRPLQTSWACQRCVDIECGYYDVPA
jgi:hypothetical protein